jgi:ribosome-binding factor A
MPHHDPKTRRGASRGPGRGAGRNTGRSEAPGRSQRQLKAGELVRHSLSQILREEPLRDPELLNRSITVTEVRLSPDFRHATVFVEPLGGENAAEVVAALNRVAKYLRGVLGRSVEMKFTPELRFFHDESFDAALSINKLFDHPVVQRDLSAPPSDNEPGEDR